MSNQKTLYLHIGCGKTGSSALQVWLNHQAEALRALGVDYPSFGRGKLDTYAITSGNGKKLIDAVVAGEGAAFLNELAKSPARKIFLSSEAFQSLTEDNLRELKANAAQAGMRVEIIVYVRDVYDVVYSAYQQLIKRHLGAQTFNDYGLKRVKIQQFEVVAAYERAFEDIHVFHYDSERERGLEKAMLEALGLDPAKVPPMPDAKVNRSLDVEESELLRLVNQRFVQHCPAGSNTFSARISDALIYADPEHETEILLDDSVLKHLEVLCRPAIDELNARYLRKTPMTIFNPTGKKVVRELPAIRGIYGTTIDSVIKLMAAQGEAGKGPGGEGPAHRPLRQGPARHAAASAGAHGAAGDEGRRGNAGGGGGGGGGVGDPLSCTDPRVANALRDEAIRIEKKDLPRALALMTAAAALRPNGAAIKKKLDEYQAKIH